MAYKSIFEEGEIKPATTPKASTGYVSIFDDEEKKLEPITTQSVPVKISPLVPEQKSTSVTDYLFKELSPKTTTTETVNKRYVQDPTRPYVSIPFEQADPKTQYENLTYDEIKKMKSSELVDLRRRAGIDKGDSKKWYSSFMAGIGDIMTTIGSTMKWKGAEGGLIDRIGENIQEAGKITQSKYTDYEALEKLGEFDWADLKDVSFWKNKVPRMLPFTMSLIPLAIIGGSVGATAGASLGLGALVTTITGAIGSAVLSRPLEGMMEAGSTYDEAIAKGFSEEKAQKAANQVFIENLKQMSVLDVIQMIPLLKGIKGFKIPNSTVNKIVNIAGTGTAIVSEGFEEVLQNKIVSDALGEKFDLASPETKESFVLGTIMGGVFQGTGGIVNISQRAITNATKENLSKKNQAIFEKNFDKFMKEGETRSDSEVLALNEVAKIDQKGLQDAITKALNEKSQELKDAGIEQQASTVLKEETPADKLAKQIKKSDPIDRLLATIEEQEVETKVEEPLVQEADKESEINLKDIPEYPIVDSEEEKIKQEELRKKEGIQLEEIVGLSEGKEMQGTVVEKWRDEDIVMDMYKVRLSNGEVKEFTEESVFRFIPAKEEDILKPISTKTKEKRTKDRVSKETKKSVSRSTKRTEGDKREEVKSKSVESIIGLPKKEAIQKLQESIKENGFVKGGEEVLNKVATPTLNRGIDLEAFKRKPTILNLIKENVFTDSFLLINDKEIAKKLYKEVKDKTGIEEDKSEPAIEWKQVVPEKWGNNEADIIGYENLNEESWHNFKLMVRLTDGETNAYVDANKLAFMKKQLPIAKMYLSGQNTPVVFIERGKVKGLLMPINTGKDYKAKYQELGESKKLPDIQLKKDVITKDMQGNKITLKEGEVFSVYELPKNRYLLEGKESYTVPKNQFQNIKGQSIIAEAKEFAPELEGTEESIKSAETKKKIPEGYGEKPLEQYKAELKRQMPKYENYTLPGGENYREILIKAPVVSESEARQANADKIAKELYGKTHRELWESGEIDKWDNVTNLNKTEYGTPAFRGSHWDEPNVLFHLRMNDRIYNGNKVSFMEEFQSDWAREGRDKGFSKNLPKGTENDIEIKFVKSNVPEGHDPKNYPGYYEAFDKRTGDFLGRGGTKPDLMERALEEINLTEGVPYNPLLKNWQVSAIKRALIESVDSDYFAWTNGEQQKARYNLSDKVDNIEWFTKNKEKGISIRLLNKKSVDIYIDENGKIIKSDKKDWKGENLQNVIGKGLSEKIMEKDDGMLSGIDLDVGGEWANSLYDIQAKKI